MSDAKAAARAAKAAKKEKERKRALAITLALGLFGWGLIGLALLDKAPFLKSSPFELTLPTYAEY